MSTIQRIPWKFVAFASRAALFLVFAVGVTMLLFWLAGSFAPKVSVEAERPPANGHTGPVTVAQVRMIRVPMIETAVGTVRPVREASLGARLHGRVVEVNLKAGQAVSANDVLVRLDDQDLQAKKRQAEAVLQAALAARAQAEA